MTPHLTLVKNVVNGSTGTASSPDWTLTATDGAGATPINEPGITNTTGPGADVISGTHLHPHRGADGLVQHRHRRLHHDRCLVVCQRQRGFDDRRRPTAATVAPTDGADITCTITNTYQPVATAAKTVASTVENDNGSWTITYDLVVTNPDTALAATYSLSDTPGFGTGMTITGATVTMPDGTAGPAWDGSGTDILATDRPLAAGATETWTIALTATVAAAVPPADTACSPQGTPGFGFFNSATITTWSGSEDTSACSAPVFPTLTKSAVSVLPHLVSGAPDGSWDVTYNITVTNPSDVDRRCLLAGRHAVVRRVGDGELGDGDRLVGRHEPDHAADQHLERDDAVHRQRSSPAGLRHGQLHDRGERHRPGRHQRRCRRLLRGRRGPRLLQPGDGHLRWAHATADACTPVPHWVLSKSSDPASGSTVNPGDTITYTLTADNTSSATVTGATAVDTLPTNAALVTAGLDPSLDDSVAGTLTWTIPDIAPHTSVSVSYPVTVERRCLQPDGRQRRHHVITGWRVRHGRAICTTDHFTPHYVLSKTSDPASGSTVEPGDTITYTLTVHNDSDATVAGAVVTDDLSDVLNNASVVSVGAGASITGTTLTWNVPTIAAGGADATLSYTVKVNADAIGVTIRERRDAGSGRRLHHRGGVHHRPHRPTAPGLDAGQDS